MFSHNLSNTVGDPQELSVDSERILVLGEIQFAMETDFVPIWMAKHKIRNTEWTLKMS